MKNYLTFLNFWLRLKKKYDMFFSSCLNSSKQYFLIIYTIKILIMVPEGGSVAVIGSGISGLSYSFYLSKLRPDVNIKIFEASNRSGGYIYSKETPLDNSKNETTIFEKGPRTLRSISEGTSLIASLFKHVLHREDEVFGVEKESSANRKYILDTSNQLAEVPHGSIFSNSKLYFDFFTKYNITKKIFSDIFKEPFRAKTSSKDDESVESFLARRFGPRLPANIVSAVYHGIFAGDIGQLSADSIMKSMRDIEVVQNRTILVGGFMKVFEKKQIPIVPRDSVLLKYQRYFLDKSKGEDIMAIKDEIKKYSIISFDNGLETITKAYVEELNKMKNVEFIRECDAKQLIKKDKQITVMYQKEATQKVESDSFDIVNSTVSSISLARLLPIKQNSKTIDLLNSIKYSKVVLVNIFIKGKDYLANNPGFGYLIPKSYYYEELGNNYKAPLLGVIFDSDTEKYKVPVFVKSQAALKQSQEQQKYTKLTAMMGGYMWSSASNIPDIKTCVLDLKKQLVKGLKVDLDDIKKEDVIIEANLITGDGIPQYTVGYNGIKEEIEKNINLDFEGRLKLSGMCFNGGIGVPDCVSHGLELALEDSGKLTEEG